MLDVSLLFHEVEDPRRSNATRHDLQEMLLIALLSALSGGEGCVDRECFGRAKAGFLRQFLRLEHGIPSHDAFSNLFRSLDPCRSAWRAAADREGLGEGLGGAARRRGGGGGWRWTAKCSSARLRTRRSPLHLVQAFAADGKLVLGQMEVDGRSNEIPALPKLLDIHGRMVTADAMHPQRETSLVVLALQGHPRALHENVKQHLDHPPDDGTIFSHPEVNESHGRVETRTASITHDLGAALERHRWPGLAAVGKVVAEHRPKDGKASVETRYYMTSAQLSAERFALGHRKLPALGGWT